VELVGPKLIELGWYLRLLMSKVQKWQSLLCQRWVNFLFGFCWVYVGLSRTVGEVVVWDGNGQSRGRNGPFQEWIAAMESQRWDCSDGTKSFLVGAKKFVGMIVRYEVGLEELG
jgi:hypothetical protein